MLSSRLLKTLLISVLLSPVAYAAKPLVYGETARVDTYDPYTAHEATGQRLADLLFDSLFVVGPGGQYVPVLADTYEIKDGGRKVEVTLKKDVAWHGEDKKFLSPADVVTTVKQLQSKGSEIPNAERFMVIEGVNVMGELKVEIVLRRASTDPLRYLMFKVLPDHKVAHLNGLKRDSEFALKPIGTGPYEFVAADDMGEVKLKANPKYFAGAPKIAEIVMKSYADQNVMAQSLMFNSLDLITYVSPRDLSELIGDSRLGVLPYDALSFSFIALNNSRPGLTDKRVRQALAMAVNRSEMLSAFFQGKGRLISGPFPPTSWAYNVDVKSMEFDVTRSRDLLRAAGYGAKGDDKGNKLKLVFAVPMAGESEMIKRVALAFQSYMSDVGVDVDLQFMDWLVWKKRVIGDRDYDVTIASWSFDDASNITSLFHSSSIKSWGNNFVGYSNAEVDALLVEADSTNDFEKRRAIYHKLHATLADDTPYIYLWTLMHHAAHGSRVAGVKIEPYAFFRHIASWSFVE